MTHECSVAGGICAIHGESGLGLLSLQIYCAWFTILVKRVASRFTWDWIGLRGLSVIDHPYTLKHVNIMTCDGSTRVKGTIVLEFSLVSSKHGIQLVEPQYD